MKNFFINKYINTFNGIFSKYLYGFIKGHITQHCLLCVLKKMLLTNIFVLFYFIVSFLGSIYPAEMITTVHSKQLLDTIVSLVVCKIYCARGNMQSALPVITKPMTKHSISIFLFFTSNEKYISGQWRERITSKASIRIKVSFEVGCTLIISRAR